MSMYVKGTPDDLSQVISGLQATGKEEKTEEKAVAIASVQKENLQEQETEESNPMAAALRRADKQIKAHTATTKKAKEAKAAQKKLMPPKEIEEGAKEFSHKNPKFPPVGLIELTKKLKDGMTKEEILKVVNEQYANPEDASLALEFLISIAVEDYKETLQLIKSDLNSEISDKREKEVSKKVEAEAAQATLKASEAALKIVQGGDLTKLLEHFMNNPLDAPDIFKTLDSGYGEGMESITKFLLKQCGAEVNKLKDLEDKEDVAHMKNTMALLKKLQAIMGVDKYFKIRNPDAKAAAPKKRKTTVK